VRPKNDALTPFADGLVFRKNIGAFNMLRLSFALILAACPAMAQDTANGAAIVAAVSGNTINGNMSASGVYAEYYAPDGQIKAADYAGKWTVEGDKMCFAYSEDPASCWSVAIVGSNVTWISDVGTEGTGTIVAGNPNGW
jgi:hypothetical protein